MRPFSLDEIRQQVFQRGQTVFRAPNGQLRPRPTIVPLHVINAHVVAVVLRNFIRKVNKLHLHIVAFQNVLHCDALLFFFMPNYTM